MSNDVKSIFLAFTWLLIRVCNAEQSKRSPEDIGSEFGLVSMLILVVFCLLGSVLCLYFTCCHEYMCEPHRNAGCCYKGPTDQADWDREPTEIVCQGWGCVRDRMCLIKLSGKKLRTQGSLQIISSQRRRKNEQATCRTVMHMVCECNLSEHCKDERSEADKIYL